MKNMIFSVTSFAKGAALMGAPLWMAGICGIGAVMAAPAVGVGVGVAAVAGSVVGFAWGASHVVSLVIQAGKGQPGPILGPIAFPVSIVAFGAARMIEGLENKLLKSFNKEAQKAPPKIQNVPQNNITPPKL